MMDERCSHVTVKGLVFDEHGRRLAPRALFTIELESLSIAPHIQLLATWL